MANKNIPSFKIKVSAAGLNALCIELYRRLHQRASIMRGSLAETATEQMMWWHTHALIKEWVKKLDRETTGETLKVEFDVAQALAFLTYWGDEELPDYEATIMYRLIAGIDQALVNQKNKIVK